MQLCRVFNIRQSDVDAAFSQAMALLSHASPDVFPNGVVLFCSAGFGQIMHPPEPVQAEDFTLALNFKVSLIHRAIDVHRTATYGLVVIDGNEATIGTVVVGGRSARSRPATRLKHFTSGVGSRTRRGGQSALRYSRLRESGELAFLRRVADHMGTLLVDTSGVIIGGAAAMKRKLVLELPAPLRERVVGVVDLATSADSDALQKVASHATCVAKESRLRTCQRDVARFLDLAERPGASEAMVCYGETHTATALEMGAVGCLLVAAKRNTGERSVVDWRRLAVAFGTTVVEVGHGTEQEVLFSRGYGVGGFLRWPLDPEMLESPASEEEPDQPSNERSLCGTGKDDVASDVASECGTDSTADTARLGPSFVSWLEEELTQVLDDEASAQALAACVEVIVSDSADEAEEAVVQAVEVLRSEGISEVVLAEVASFALAASRNW